MVINATWERDGHKCVFCSKPLRRKLYWNERGEFESPEFDHIIPFCEGGKTILENMRTLCHDCHKKRTAEWHAERAKKRREEKQKAQEVLNFTP